MKFLYILKYSDLLRVFLYHVFRLEVHTVCENWVVTDNRELWRWIKFYYDKIKRLGNRMDSLNNWIRSILQLLLVQMNKTDM